MYASGKYAIAQCDRCGFKVRYRDLHKEWNGWWVCSDCFDPKHPNISPEKVPPAPEALEHPRPDRDNPGSNAEQLYDYFEMTFGDTKSGDG